MSSSTHRSTRARRALAALRRLLLLLVLAPTAYADGLGGLGALRAMVMTMAVAFCVLWIVVWALNRGYRKLSGRHQDRPVGGGNWLRDKSIPLGLRILSVVQYVLAFGYALRSFITAMFPYARHNGHVAEYLIHDIVFGAIFAALLIKVANGYIRRSRKWGYTAGIWLGVFALINLVVYWALHGGYFGLSGADWISSSFGLILIILLALRYNDYFGAASQARTLLRGLNVLARSGAIVIALLALTSFAYTSGSYDGASQALDDVKDAMSLYRAQNGHWPATLEDIDPSVKHSYRFRQISYDRDELELHLMTNVEYIGPAAGSSLIYRISFGQLGRRGTQVTGMGKMLE